MLEVGIRPSFLNDTCTQLEVRGISVYVGTKTHKFPLLVMDMPVRILGSVHVLAFYLDPLPELY
jgi:hypothetical protein